MEITINKLYRQLCKLEYKTKPKAEKVGMTSSDDLLKRKHSIADDKSFADTIKK